jgi:hypothetical protein
VYDALQVAGTPLAPVGHVGGRQKPHSGEDIKGANVLVVIQSSLRRPDDALFERLPILGMHA